ncbi:uncharacterized protein PV09_08397 [Verruconis gallopava]|uniref:Dienelactone hydrolase domain-containing protein n=1 Tax=Verruconis gallopava TaxID=253628 RepID=A0A0D2A183_9PEZI|nr:uncharacterized protein PV09_08397 [Verruconis gallopava]KIW00050.1 hypothetical protein PV09_08397 [Verruconis gallopava]
MKECCIRGVKHEGEPKGEIKEVGGVKCYVAKAENSEYGVLYIPDAFGLELTNNRLLADDFAAAGYTTVIPDIFHGDPVPADALGPQAKAPFDLMKWFHSHPPERVEPVLQAAIKGMKEEYGVKKLGAVGYCFGGRYVVRFLGNGLIDAGFGAHVSFVSDEEFDAVKGPLSLACAEVDQIFPTEKRHKTEEILAKLGIPYESRVFSGTNHGFAVRCDLSDPKQKYAKEAAFTQATLWFDQWVKA